MKIIFTTLLTRSYLGCTEIIGMISRRLTKTQKAEILEAYMAGDSAIDLAEKYRCTANTVNRTVKTSLSDSEYKLLKEKRSKIINKKRKLVDNEFVKEKKNDSKESISLISPERKLESEDQSIRVDKDFYIAEAEEMTSFVTEDANQFCEDLSSEKQNKKNLDKDNNNKDFDNNFEEILPLISNYDFDQEKQKSDFEILNYESLPESVYMIVDKKVELDFQSISDLPEWSFLPDNELKRNAIILFPNQRSAKRSCSRNQRVIKIPNTSIFELSKSYLVSKGITRLILENLIIALDN